MFRIDGDFTGIIIREIAGRTVSLMLLALRPFPLFLILWVDASRSHAVVRANTMAWRLRGIVKGERDRVSHGPSNLPFLWHISHTHTL